MQVRLLVESQSLNIILTIIIQLQRFTIINLTIHHNFHHVQLINDPHDQFNCQHFLYEYIGNRENVKSIDKQTHPLHLERGLRANRLTSAFFSSLVAVTVFVILFLQIVFLYN